MRPTIAYALTLVLAGAADAAAAGPRMKLYVSEPGVYAVTQRELLAAGWKPPDALPSSRLELTSNGRAVPIWVEDGGDGRFGLDDRLVFVGEPARDADGRRNTHARWNVYYLAAAGRGSPQGAAPGCPAAGELSGVVSLEK